MPQLTEKVNDEVKYQIFISSTYADLKAARRHVIREILRAEQFPIAMEHFVASDKGQWQTIERFLSRSACVILLVGKKRGTVDERDDKHRTFTEKEYDFAIEHNIPVLAFISAKITNNDESYDFKQRVEKADRLACHFNNCADLSGAVARSITNEKSNFINPWRCESNQDRKANCYPVEQLSTLPNGNYWNADAKDMYKRYEDQLKLLPDKWLKPMKWEGGKDFNSLFEIRDDDNVISGERRKAGIIKSIRYVYTEESGEMLVTGWFCKKDK